MAPAFVKWMESVLASEPTDRGRDLTPLEQVTAMFDQFVGDLSFRGVGDFVLLKPQFQGVYEMKVTDVRVFGWFVQRCVFVAVSGEMKRKLKGNAALVKRHILDAAAFRAHLHLDAPDHVTGRMHELL